MLLSPSLYCLLLVTIVTLSWCEGGDISKHDDIDADTSENDVTVTEQNDMRKSAKSGYHGNHHEPYHGYGGGPGKSGYHHNKHHYNPCGSIFEKTGFCFHKYAGHYAHHNAKCYVQCDAWGRGYVRPCAKGTYWIGGKGPTKYNKCVGRYQKRHHGNKYNHGGGYGGGGYGGGGYGGGYGGFGGGFYG